MELGEFRHFGIERLAERIGLADVGDRLDAVRLACAVIAEAIIASVCGVLNIQ
jgi:hypothetical protein